jgi:hypothetical protein
MHLPDDDDDDDDDDDNNKDIFLLSWSFFLISVSLKFCNPKLSK